MMVMEMAGDVCATVRMYLMPLNHTCKRGKFYVMYILPWNKPTIHFYHRFLKEMFTSKSFIFPFCHRLDQYWLAHNHTPASGNSYSTILSFCRWKNSGAERKCLIQMPQGVFMNGTVISRFLANYSFYHTRPIIIGNLLYSFSVVLFRLYYYWFQI